MKKLAITAITVTTLFTVMTANAGWGNGMKLNGLEVNKNEISNTKLSGHGLKLNGFGHGMRLNGFGHGVRLNGLGASQNAFYNLNQQALAK